MEKIIETRICICGAHFNITDLDFDFLSRLAPVIGGQKFELPLPTLCPECRKFQRLAWRNEKNIYKRKCDYSDKDIIAIYSPESKYKVYDEKIWSGDSFNPLDFSQDFDFSRSFFEQFQDLLLQVPVPSKSSVACENSDYCNASTALKNCYLTFSANTCEDVLYSVDLVRSKTCVDCFGIVDTENSYECIVASKCYNIEHSYDVKNCSNSKFLLSCDGCEDCYGCFGLINSKYHIFNISYSKEEYDEKLKELLKLPLQVQKKQFEDFYKDKYIKKPLPNIGSENVYESENVINSKNVSYSKHVLGTQDVRYCQKMQVPGANLVMDYTGFGNNASKIYYSQQIGNNASNIYFTQATFGDVSNIFYSVNCRNGVNNCFGCVGLKNAESYCILNKQYTREEYETLVPKIIELMKKTGEWGEFFPASLSPYGYNESVSQIMKPLTKDEALTRGFNWSDYEAPFPKVEKIIPANQLPDDISKIPDDILNWAVECEKSGKPFRIIRPELEFYRKHNLPIPKKHPDERYIARLKWYFNY